MAANLTSNKHVDKINGFYYINKYGYLARLKKRLPTSAKKEMDFLTIRKYIDLGVSLATPIVLMTFLGIFLDKKLNTQPKFTLITVVVGMMVSFYNLWLLVKSEHAAHKH